MESGFFESIGSFVDETLLQLTSTLTSGYAELLMQVLAASLVLSITLQGYLVIAGKMQQPMQDILWEAGRVVLIVMFVTNANGILDSALSAIDELKIAFITDDKNIFSRLDAQFERGQELAATIFSKDTSKYVKAEGALGSLLVWIGLFVALLIPALIMFTTTITLKLLTLTAPIFIFCLIYGFLRNMFAQWLQLIFANILTLIFVSLVMDIGMAFYAEQLRTLNGAVSDEINLVLYGGLALMSGIFVAVMCKLALSLAQSIASVSIEASAASIARETGASAAAGGKFAAQKGYAGGKFAAQKGYAVGQKVANSEAMKKAGEQAKARWEAVRQSVIARNNKN